MEGLVNYSSEDESEETTQSKVAESVDQQDGSRRAIGTRGGDVSDSLKPIRRYSSSDSNSKDEGDDEVSSYIKSPKKLEDEYRNSLAKPSFATKHVGNRYIDDNEDKDQQYSRAPKREKKRDRESERERDRNKDKDDNERFRRGDYRETRDYNSRDISRNNRDEARNYNERNRKYEHSKRDKYDDRYESRQNHDKSYNYGKHHRYDDKYGNQRYDHKSHNESNRSRYNDRRAARVDDRPISYGDRRDDRRGQSSTHNDCNSTSKNSSSSSYRYKRSPTPPPSSSSERIDSGSKRLDKRDDYYSIKRSIGSSDGSGGGENTDRGGFTHRSRSRSPSNVNARPMDKPLPYTQSHQLENKHERETDTEIRSAQMAIETTLAFASRPVLATTSTAPVPSKLPTSRNFEHLCNVPLNISQDSSVSGVKNKNFNTNATLAHATSAMGAIGGGVCGGEYGLNNSTATAVAEKPQLPSYYNPHVINPNKYAQQMQKRKLLWGAKKTDATTTAKWENAQFSEDTDGKVASKFMRLMGIKSSSGSGGGSGSGAGEIATTTTNSNSNIDQKLVPTKSSVDGSATLNSSSDIKSREAMFSTMEQQYEVARAVTHTMRGVGLGFGNPSY